VAGQTETFNDKSAARPVPDCTVEVTLHQIVVHGLDPYSPPNIIQQLPTQLKNTY